jgi:hypothetical protein
VIISDQTPWNDVERKNAGFILNINKFSTYKGLLQTLVAMSNGGYMSISNAAIEYVNRIQRTANLLSKYLAFLDT